MIEALLGPLGGLLAAIVAVAGAWLLGKRGGRSAARTEREAQDNEAYRNERARQDDLDTGADDDDDARIERLRRIANGGGAGDA